MLMLGCSSPEQNADQSARTARSWAATALTTSEALAKGAIPRVYATQVLQEAMETKRRLAQQPEWQSLPRHIRDQLDDSIRRLSSALAERSYSLPRS
jgi:hypothetical protein